MFDRLQKPFLTVETGEAYQPVRVMYNISNKDAMIQALESLQCIQKGSSTNSWTWHWEGECADTHFESVDSYVKNLERPLRLGTISLRDDKLYFNFPSFKRACLAVPFFYNVISADVAQASHADFINKVFGLDERIPHGFSELFKEEELDRILHQRIEEFNKIQEQCESAGSAEEALNILSEYTHSETQKRLPYAERYHFDTDSTKDSDILFLSFYIFLRGRELVAIKRWFGQTGYTLADAMDETFEQVFGGLGVDIIE